MRGKALVLRVLRRKEAAGDPEAYPQTIFLFVGLGPEARKAFEVFPDEALALRTLADMEAARSRLWSGQGQVWDAGVCAGRAQGYQAAAEQLEEALIDALELWDEYEQRAG